jgi:prepilin-type N-terminal cleavage/methylation domain-containing protein
MKSQVANVAFRSAKGRAFAEQEPTLRPFAERKATFRHAYTLTELLVVVAIVVILLAATLPVAKRVMDDSRTRDSARLLAGNFQMAKTMAARHNRPYGLWFELAPVLGQPATVRQCTQVFLAEVPPPYAGSTTNARGIIRIEQGQTIPEFNPLTGVDNNPADGYIDIDTAEKSVLLSLIDEGDTCLVKFEFKGDWFHLIRGKATNAAYPDPQRLYASGSVSGTAIPPAYNTPTSSGFHFQILRSPRRVGNPIELIAGTCIDMEYCGMGVEGGELALPLNRVVVMFAPSGAVDGLILDDTLMGSSGTLHFLVGQVEKMNDPGGADADHPTNMIMFDPDKSNLSDVNSVWASVGRQSGQVVTSENLVPPVDRATLSPTTVTIFPLEAVPPAGRRQTLNPTVSDDRKTYVRYCREAAIGREQMGGQ